MIQALLRWLRGGYKPPKFTCSIAIAKFALEPYELTGTQRDEVLKIAVEAARVEFAPIAGYVVSTSKGMFFASLNGRGIVVRLDAPQRTVEGGTDGYSLQFAPFAKDVDRVNPTGGIDAHGWPARVPKFLF
jgi:hypothetical protein